MTVVTNSQFLRDMENIKTNPLAVQRLMINALDTSLNGEERLLDPTSPFTFLLEGTVAVGVAGMQQAASLNRIQYANSANTYQDLFYHMSDVDYLNIFSSPSRTNFIFILGVDDIISKGKKVPGSINTKRITIPKHTVIKVAGLTFTMQYPIIIDITTTGVIKCYLDTTNKSPIHQVTDNNLKWAIRRINGISCLTIEVPVLQLELTSSTIDVNIATVIKRDFLFPDLFYYCRVHMFTANGWEEIRTTHCPEVYNPNKATALLTIANNTMTLEIPQVYLSNGLVRGSLRVDIYTTKGVQDLSLSSYSSESFSYLWQDLDNDGSEYYAPLVNFGNIAIVSTSVVVGGHNGLSFEQLRDIVVNRSQTTAGLPLTNKQIPEYFRNLGYGFVTDIDNLTNRTFLATKEAPIPKSGVTITGVDLSVHTLRTSIDILTKFNSVKDNGPRITITPSMLYTTSNGILSPVGDIELTKMLNPTITSPDALANIINTGDFLFTPFYYVLDVNNTNFNCRVFNLDYPSIVSKETVDTNHTLNLQMSLIGSSIGRIDDGYQLIVEYDPKSDIKDIDLRHVRPQLSYSIGGGARGYVTGVFYGDIDNGIPISGRYRWSFDIRTEFDINNFNQLILKPNNFPVNLTNDFDVITILEDYLPIGATVSHLDDLTDVMAFDDFAPGKYYVALTQDKFTINFGKQLDYIWTRSRTAPDFIQYETYEEDVYTIAERDIPKYIASGVPSIKINQSTGKPYVEIATKAGEFIFDNNGDKIIKHARGSVKKDIYGQPKVKNGDRGLIHELELVLLDGAYYFTNDELSVGYVEEATKAITEWSSTDMAEIKRYLLPKTEIFYYPKISSGTIKVLSPDNVLSEISARQTLSFTFYVSEEVKKSLEIQEIINNTTKYVVSEYFKKKMLAKDELLKEVRAALNENIRGVSLNGFLGDVFDICTMMDDTVRPSIGKSVQALTNLSLRVNDTITFEYRVI